MSHDRAIRNLAEDVIDQAIPVDHARETNSQAWKRIDELANRLQTTVECYLQDIEQEDREAEQKRADRLEAQAEEAGEARDERLWVERKATNG